VLTPLVLGLLLAADPKPASLPADWHGEWTGTLGMTSRNDTKTDVPVRLKIGPISGSDDLTWKLTYGTGDNQQTKDYKLVPTKTAGRFRIDEQNGIVLDARLVGGVLYSQFEVGGSWLTARYELRDGKLRFEVTSAKPAAEKTGGKAVQGYEVGAVQTADLTKR
jgi:hypothetical protein